MKIKLSYYIHKLMELLYKVRGYLDRDLNHTIYYNPYFKE